MAASSQGKESSMPPITCSYSGNILYQERYQRTQRIHFALSRLKKCHRDYRAVAVFLSDTETRVIWRHFDTQARVVWRSLWHLISAWVGNFAAKVSVFFCWTSHKWGTLLTPAVVICVVEKQCFEPILTLAWQFPVHRHIWPDGL